MAATKEAIVIVLDVGQSMHGNLKEDPSVLESAKSCVNMIIQRKIFSESKDEVALILVGTHATANNLSEQGDPEFSNIEVIQDFKTANWELLEFVNGIMGTDISTEYIKDNALLVAADMLALVSSKKFFSRRILFLSRSDGIFSSEKVHRLCDELRTAHIDLNIIGPDSLDDDPSDGTDVKPFMRTVMKQINGECYSFSEAIPALIYYQKKKVSPLPWNANLDIGTNLTIPISAYVKVSENKPKTWKTVYSQKLNAKVERNVTFMMNDAEQTKVSRDNIVPAFKYGTTLVPFTDEDKQNMEYQSGDKGMKVLGFTKAENVHKYHYTGDKSWYVYGQKNRELAGVILAPFIQALHETKMVAIVRYVYSARSAPRIGFLAPKIKSNYECLVFVLLPFMEDLRHFVFAPLDADSKNLPTEEQLSAVDDLITSMDLSTASVDDEGNLGEALKPRYTPNPYLQRLYQCLHHRGLHPLEPLPPISAHVLSIINPPPKLLKMAEPALEKIAAVFPLKVPELKTSKGETSYSVQKLDGNRKRRRLSEVKEELDAQGVGLVDKITKVGSIQPVQDFQYLISSEIVPFGEACKQVIEVAFQFLENENLKHYHSKLTGICKELRHVSLKKSNATQYNQLMKDLQKELLSKDIELWTKLQNEKVGLISNAEVGSSSVSPEEADAFLSMSESQPKSSVKSQDVFQEEEDYDDLLDQL